MESLNSKLAAEKQELTLRLEREKETTAEADERSAKILAQKADVERQVSLISKDWENFNRLKLILKLTFFVKI